MRKLVILFASILIAVIGYGQNTALDVKSLENNFDVNFKVNNNRAADNFVYSWFYGNESTDTIDASDTWNRDYSIRNLYDALKHECRVELDSISGTPTVTVTLEGKYSYNDGYTSIATATWSGTSADTTIILQGSTAKPYRFINFKAVADATAQKVQIERVEVGVYK